MKNILKNAKVITHLVKRTHTDAKSRTVIWPILSTFVGKMGVATTRSSWSKASKLNQKICPLGGPFGSTNISKSCFRNFQRCISSPSPLRYCYQQPQNLLPMTVKLQFLFQASAAHYVA